MDLTESRMSEYRWFLSSSSQHSHMSDANHFWTPFDIDISEKIEDSYQQGISQYDLNELYIIKFDYKTNQHLQKGKNENDNDARAVMREIPSKVENIVRTERIGMRENEECTLYENISFDQFRTFCYSEIFSGFQIDEADPFIRHFTLCTTLLDIELAGFLSTNYVNYLQKFHKLHELNFQKLIDILCADLSYDNLTQYVHVYAQKLTQSNFNEIIPQMFTEEGLLYKNLNTVMRNKSITVHVEYLLFLLCLLYAISNRKNTINADVTVYRGLGMSHDRYNKFKQICSVDQVITNDDFMFTTLNINNVEKFINNSTFKKKILLEIKIEKESCENSLLHFKPFDVSKLSQYNEEEIIFPPGGAFQVCQVVEEKGWPTIIQMEYRTNLLKDSLPFMCLEKKLQKQFGYYSTVENLKQEEYASIIFVNMSPSEIEQLSKMKNLQQLDLSRNSIEVSKVKMLSSQLIHLPSLKQLSLYNCRIHLEGIEILSQVFKYLINLEDLNLWGNALKNEGTKVLALELSNLPNLFCLDVGDNGITSEGISDLSKELVQLTKLKYLKLSCNKLGDEGLKELSSQLKYLTGLSALMLRNTEIGYEGLQAFVSQLSHLSNLEILDMGLDDLGDEGIKALSSKLIHLGRLKEFYLYNNQITSDGIKEFAAYLVHLPQLQELELCENRIGNEGVIALAEQLIHVPHLEYLNLTCTDLGNEGMRALASQFCHVTNLRHLICGRNKVGEEIVEELASHLVHLNKLEYLDFNNNHIENPGISLIRDTLKVVNPAWSSYRGGSSCPHNHTWMCFLSVFTRPNEKKEIFTQQYVRNRKLFEGDSLRLEPKEFKCIKTFEYFSNLKSLDLRNNEIGPEELLTFAPQLSYLKNLQELNLGDNDIGRGGMETFAEVLSQLVNLEELSLIRNRINNEAMETLALQLKPLTKLRCLDLSFNPLGYEGIASLAQQLIHLPQLEQLKIAGVQLNYGMGILTSELENLTNLRRLDLDCNDLQGAAIQLLVTGIIHTKKLEELGLSYNQITDESMSDLASAFKYLPNLKKINLQKNLFGKEGMQEFAAQLPFLLNLQELDLSINSISNEGIKALAEQFSHLPNLKKLDLSITEIGDEGMKAIAANAMYLTNLQKLDMFQNNISDEGMKVFASQAIYLPNLENLELSMNQIGEEGMKAFAEQIVHLTHLHKLSLLCNKVKDIRDCSTVEEIEIFRKRFHTE